MNMALLLLIEKQRENYLYELKIKKMNCMTNIDQFFCPPNPQTLKGKLKNIKPSYYIIGGVIIVVFITGIYSLALNSPVIKYYSKGTEKTES